MIENLINCLDIYIKTGQRHYLITEGEVHFYNKNDTETGKIIIQGFFLKKEYQRIGILKEFLNYLSLYFDEIWFTQCNPMMSCILLTTCLNDRYFINRYTGEHYWTKNGNYNSEKCLDINKKLLPLKEILKKDYELFNKMILNDAYRYLL